MVLVTCTKPPSSFSGNPQSITTAKRWSLKEINNLKYGVRLIRVFYKCQFHTDKIVNALLRLMYLLIQTGGVADHTPDDRQVLTEVPTSW